MKKLDRYIIKKFLGTVFFTVILFIAITVVIDLSERIDEFIENEAPFHLIVTGYYANFIPHIVFLLSPLFIFIATIFFTSQMAYRSEIIAILAGGISFYRILFVPYCISATVLVCLQLYGNHYWVPESNKERLIFEGEYIRKKRYNKDRNIHMQINKGTFIYVESYSERDSSGQKFTLERTEGHKLKYKLTAHRIKWNGQKNRGN